MLPEGRTYSGLYVRPSVCRPFKTLIGLGEDIASIYFLFTRSRLKGSLWYNVCKNVFFATYLEEFIFDIRICLGKDIIPMDLVYTMSIIKLTQATFVKRK